MKRTYFINNSGSRWVTYEENGKKVKQEFTTLSGKKVKKTVQFFESFGNHVLLGITHNGMKMKVFADEVLSDKPDVTNGLVLNAWYIINNDNYAIVGGPYVLGVAKRKLSAVRAISNATFNIYQYVETIEGKVWHNTEHQKAYSLQYIMQYNELY